MVKLSKIINNKKKINFKNIFYKWYEIRKRDFKHDSFYIFNKNFLLIKLKNKFKI